jgi:hypothetical protein
MAFDKNRSQVRTASGPHITASLRNLVITIWRLAGSRHHHRHPPGTTPGSPADHDERS